IEFIVPLWLWWGRRSNRLGLPEIGELNLAAIERKIVFEDDVQRRAAWQFRFRPAGQKYGCQSCGCPNPRADAKSFHSVGNSSNSCASGGRLRDGADVLPFPAGASDFALGIHRFLAAGVGAPRRGVQADSVAVRQDQGIQAQAEFTAALDATGAFGFQQFAAKIRSHWNYHAVV